MNYILSISANDFRTTFRDPVFKALLFFPLIAFVLVRWLLPIIVNHYPIIEQYRLVILMWSCMQAATMFGFIYGFIFLEEKEENINDVLHILPVSFSHLTYSRLLIGVMVSMLTNYLLLHFGNIISLPLWKELLIAFQFALLAPLMALLLNYFAGNKIEGLAQIKIINIVLNLPALIYFIPNKLINITAVIPTYWSFRSLEAAETKYFLLFYCTGISLYLLFLNNLIEKPNNKKR